MNFDFLLFPLIISLGLNWLMFIPAYIFKTDKLTDISYSLTFLIVASSGLYMSGQQPVHFVAFAVVAIWAVRLGGYLFYRIHKMGHDSRFDEMRNSIPRFLGFWTLQGITVAVVSVPFLLIFNSTVSDLNWIHGLGIIIFILGLVIESLADAQKFKFKINGNKKWVNHGLWKKIRHPNYLGEILVWIGVWAFSLGSLTIVGAAIAAISPVFIFILLRYVSGIPLLEESHDKKWGDVAEYQAFKKRTGLLLPKI